MTTQVSHWTNTPGSAAVVAPKAALQHLTVGVERTWLPVTVWPLAATLPVTQLAMLTTIVWVFPDLTTGVLVAVWNTPFALMFLGLLCWMLLRPTQQQDRAWEGR